DKIDILISEMNSLDHQKITQLLKMLGYPYDSITTSGNHSLDYSYDNENLINALRNHSYIYNVRIHSKKLLNTKTKITFTTKS
ncbi:hypothetical protein OHV64_17875, partial [Acinetobacter baumannii]|nr:hypothetical protein [Acinetobacter baumannii]